MMATLPVIYSEILQFMLSEPLNEVTKTVKKSPPQPNAALSAPLVKSRRATAI